MWCVHPAERSASTPWARSPAAVLTSARMPPALQRQKKKKALERCFEQPVPAEVYDALAQQLASVEAEKEADRDGKEA